jgi:vanillate O-demethylase ferredoxin subunit
MRGAGKVSGSEPKIAVRVRAVTWETDAVRVYDLRALDGTLPPFTAGAHIDLHLKNGMVRSYSLLNHPDERHRYVIGVAHDNASRGGSRYVHERVGPGDVLEIGAPRNNFPLNEAAGHSVLIAGGIGVTPMIGMLKRLVDLRASWQLHYCTRGRSSAAFLEELAAFPSARLFFDDEQNGKLLDLAALVASAPPNSDFYCCGPTGMMKAFENATKGLVPERVHVEYFTAVQDPDKAGGFVVECARSGRSIPVAQGQTILEALQHAGLDVSYSCEQGICGTCETKVLEGIPDHRDQILTQAEQDSGKTMMICCSGAKSAKLVLDI